eukprot:1331236-Pyramimonas_sp.AAC.1
MSKVVFSEQQHRIFEFGRVTTMRVHLTAAVKRAVVVKENDLIANADIQANPVKVSKALYIELKTRLDDACLNERDIS